ncbi:PREDICTED: uncharacterized protein LOC106740612 [Dinoponera quadriceps]|uniref:Uncharacterized protein LOC106740612 n=1 Tax=Dinoponera quadriceps TaxID=609295 RepID=A0A6P3WNG3_DINQU|nr:PREDICTED: uncharacterized protein LOC106740612 [Dinoponera quadriceps]
MKRIAFLVLVFAYVAIAQEEGIKEWAEAFESDEETIKACLDESGTTETEMQLAKKQLDKIQEDNIDDETKKAFQKHNLFLACMMEKKGMMNGSELVVDKIMEIIENDKEPINKEMMRECLNSLNEERGIDREDRAMGITICLVAASEKKEEKKK